MGGWVRRAWAKGGGFLWAEATSEPRKRYEGRWESIMGVGGRIARWTGAATIGSSPVDQKCKCRRQEPSTRPPLIRPAKTTLPPHGPVLQLVSPPFVFEKFRAVCSGAKISCVNGPRTQAGMDRRATDIPRTSSVVTGPGRWLLYRHKAVWIWLGMSSKN